MLAVNFADSLVESLSTLWSSGESAKCVRIFRIMVAVRTNQLGLLNSPVPPARELLVALAARQHGDRIGDSEVVVWRLFGGECVP